jgi:hypothetical protein
MSVRDIAERLGTSARVVAHCIAVHVYSARRTKVWLPADDELVTTSKLGSTAMEGGQPSNARKPDPIAH